MIVRIDGNTVDGCGGNQRIVGYHAPGCGTTTTIGSLPYATSDRPKISHNAAIHCGGWIDSNGVNPAFCRRVIITAGTASHAFRLRAERDKTGGGEGQWTKWIQNSRHSCRNAHG